MRMRKQADGVIGGVDTHKPGFPFCRPLMAPLYTRDPPSPRDCFRRTIVQVLRPSLSPR